MLQSAAPAHPELAVLWAEIGERRARDMRLLAEELARVGALGEGISIDEAADLIWATNSSEFYALLVHQRGWDADRFQHWLATTCKRLLLHDA